MSPRMTRVSSLSIGERAIVCHNMPLDIDEKVAKERSFLNAVMKWVPQERSFPRFMELPLEVRREIYSYIMNLPQLVQWQHAGPQTSLRKCLHPFSIPSGYGAEVLQMDHTSFYFRPQSKKLLYAPYVTKPAILDVSHEFRAEAREILEKRHHILIRYSIPKIKKGRICSEDWVKALRKPWLWNGKLANAEVDFSRDLVNLNEKDLMLFYNIAGNPMQPKIRRIRIDFLPPHKWKDPGYARTLVTTVLVTGMVNLELVVVNFKGQKTWKRERLLLQAEMGWKGWEWCYPERPKSKWVGQYAGEKLEEFEGVVKEGRMLKMKRWMGLREYA